jgi:hypothetical protein
VDWKHDRHAKCRCCENSDSWKVAFRRSCLGEDDPSQHILFVSRGKCCRFSHEVLIALAAKCSELPSRYQPAPWAGPGAGARNKNGEANCMTWKYISRGVRVSTFPANSSILPYQTEAPPMDIFFGAQCRCQVGVSSLILLRSKSLINVVKAPPVCRVQSVFTAPSTQMGC